GRPAVPWQRPARRCRSSEGLQVLFPAWVSYTPRCRLTRGVLAAMLPPMPADSSRRTDLYPPIEPHAAGMLRVDSRHQIYWEESGNPRGVPVLFLHGGPGAGATPAHRRFFDPGFYRIVILDQRGAGRSLPHGELVDNTTPHLVADIEAVRKHRGIEQWH